MSDITNIYRGGEFPSPTPENTGEILSIQAAPHQESSVYSQTFPTEKTLIPKVEIIPLAKNKFIK